MEPTAILPKEEPTPIAAPCAIAAPRPENIPPPPAVQVKVDIVMKYAKGLGRRLGMLLLEGAGAGAGADALAAGGGGALAAAGGADLAGGARAGALLEGDADLPYGHMNVVRRKIIRGLSCELDVIPFIIRGKYKLERQNASVV